MSDETSTRTHTEDPDPQNPDSQNPEDATADTEASGESEVSEETEAPEESDSERARGRVHTETPADDDRSRRRRTYGFAGLLAALAALVVAGGFLGAELVRLSGVEDARAAALRTARQFAVDFTTLDYRKFDRDADRVLDASSGAFRTQYENATGQLKELVTANKTVTEGEVLDAGIVSFDPDSARVLVAVDAQVRNVEAEKPQLRTFRLQVDLVRERGAWRVVELQFVG
ncbi:MAG TPA: hypothetical protein VI076_02210 [Actinopolymorphaceae bacterium]